MNNHIYSTLYVQDTRKRIRQKKQRNRAKKGITKNTQAKQGQVTQVGKINFMIQLPTALTANFMDFLFFTH